MDLLIEILPVICKKYSHIEFLISGEGPKKILIEAIVKDYSLESQVRILGFLGIEKVPEILSSGDIFLNTSISEAFCIAILEAAACGLYVCTTNVGGIIEILPPDFLTLCDPSAESMIEKLCQIIDKELYKEKKNYNLFIKDYYNWHLIAKKTKSIYVNVL